MGVLACNRLGCENIMCEHHSYEHGYICRECLAEVKAKGSCSIRSFMDTAKGVSSSEVDWEEYVDTIFKSRFEED